MMKKQNILKVMAKNFKKIAIMSELLSYVGTKDNQLLVFDKEDMKNFRETTRGNIIIMGYNTYINIGLKPLPKRINVVISKNPMDIGFQKEDGTELIFISSVKDINILLGKLNNEDKLTDNVFCIGGSKTLELFEEEIGLDEIILTSFSQFKFYDKLDNFSDENLVRLPQFIIDVCLGKSNKFMFDNKLIENENFTINKYKKCTN